MQDHTPASRTTDNDDAFDDPNLWLEDVDAERAIGWVADRNAESEAVLAGQPAYDPLRRRLKTILDAKDRIPYVALHADWYYNFWRDADHPRGLWRRTTMDELSLHRTFLQYRAL